MQPSRSFRTALVSGALAFALCLTLTALGQTLAFRIPQGDLKTALDQFAAQAGVQIIYREDVVRGLRTSGAHGNFSINDALVRLLEGTSLIAQQDPSGAVAITRSLQVAPPHAGERSISAAARKRRPAIGSRRADASKSTGLQDVLITGSRLQHGDTSPFPVVVLSRAEIDQSGAVTLNEVLNTVTQISASPNLASGASTIQLRGLPVGMTLLLLNGRRLGVSSFQTFENSFDLNNIPLDAVERIEILSDSASAIYGADAIAGAVNIILRSDFDGIGAGLRFGTSAKGDATERNASLIFGSQGAAFSGMLGFSYFDRDLLLGKDRELPARDVPPSELYGGIYGDYSLMISYPANVYSTGFRPLPGLKNTFAGLPAGTDGVGLTPADFAATDGVRHLYNGRLFYTLLPKAEHKGVFANGRYEVSPNLRLFGELVYTDRLQIFQHPPPGVPIGVTVPATNPFNPFGVDVEVNYAFMEFGPEANVLTTDFARLVAGAQGELFNRFGWEVYLLRDEDSSQELHRGDTVNAKDVLQRFLDSTDPNVALNLFSTTGNNNPDTIAAILAPTVTTRDLSIRATMAEAVVHGPLFDLAAGPLRSVFGVNARRETPNIPRDPLDDLRDDRDSSAAFVEVSVPLVSAGQNVPAVHTLELSAAARNEHYAGFHSGITPRIGLVWRPFPDLMIRSSYGEAFMPPTALYLSFAPDLAPVTGQSTTTGLVWTPGFAPGLTAGFNLFQLEQNIATQILTTLLGDVEIDYGRQMVRGADLRLEHVLPTTAFGQLSGLVTGTYTDEYKILGVGEEPFSRVNHANSEGYPSRFKGTAGLHWTARGGWSAGITTRHLSSYLDYDRLRKLPSQTVLDVQVGYKFNDPSDFAPLSTLDATLGIINLTDDQGALSSHIMGYDHRRADIRGRFFYVSLASRF